MKLSRLLAILPLLISGCVTSQFMVVGTQTYPPRPEDYVIDVYLPVDAPVNVHQSIANAKDITTLPAYNIEIGRVDTQGAPAASWESVIDDAKKKARELGGDALVIKEWGHTMTGIDSYGQTYYAKNLSMTVVRLH